MVEPDDPVEAGVVDVDELESPPEVVDESLLDDPLSALAEEPDEAPADFPEPRVSVL